MPPRVLSPLAAGVLAAAALLSACSSEPTAVNPELVTRGSTDALSVTPSSLLLTSPGLSKDFTATVQYAGLLTASSSDPGCATVTPTTTTSPDKPEGSSVYVAQFTVTPVGAGSCTVMVTDKKGNVAYVGLQVVLARIAFSSPRNQTNYQIYVMDPDGQHQVPVANTSSDELMPAWSPDRTKIAFQSARDGNREIYVMGADGQDLQRLTNNTVWDGSPAWSPDGTKIAFVRSADGFVTSTDYEIWVMNANGGSEARLTNNTSVDNRPAWSPDGTKITFYSERNGEPGIYVMAANGATPTRLSAGAYGKEPNWSPDGTKIAFSRSWKIWVMDAGGLSATQLTSGEEDEEPSWSPSGTQIAFQCTYSDRICVTPGAGQAVDSLTDGSAEEVDPAWR